MSTRNVNISDEQLKLCKRGLYALRGARDTQGNYLINGKELVELDQLLEMIDNTVNMPEDPNLLHGFTL